MSKVLITGLNSPGWPRRRPGIAREVAGGRGIAPRFPITFIPDLIDSLDTELRAAAATCKLAIVT